MSSEHEMRAASELEKEDNEELETLDAALEPEGSPQRKEHWWSPKWHLLEHDRFVTSYLTSPVGLLIFRSVLWTYMTVVIVTQGVINDFSDGQSFKYFTWLSYFSLYAYFSAATLHTAVHVFKGRPALLIWQHRYLTRLFWLLYELECTYHLIVPAIYWALLAADAPSWSTDPLGAWVNISVHGFEAIFIIAEVIMNRNVILMSHIIYMVIAALLYCAYAWIWYAFGSPLPYAFLAIWWYYFALPIVFIIFYLLMFFVHLGKEKVFAKKYARKMEAKLLRQESTLDLA